MDYKELKKLRKENEYLKSNFIEISENFMNWLEESSWVKNEDNTCKDLETGKVIPLNKLFETFLKETKKK